MNKKEAIEFLREKVKEIATLAKLSPSNQSVILWRNSIEDVLKEVFGRDSDEYKHFYKTRMKRLQKLTKIQRQNQYSRQLRTRQTVIKSIIQKYELLGNGAKPSAIVIPKDTAELPTYLFDAMQFHPRVAKASKSLFTDGHYAQAIFETFKAVENSVQEKSGSILYGKQLMATVFNEDNPIIKVPEAGYFDKDVQEGFKFLFMGASQGIRNPKAHKEVVQNDPYITLEYLGFASFLLKRIDYWEAGAT